jgi:plastocyanin
MRVRTKKIVIGTAPRRARSVLEHRASMLRIALILGGAAAGAPLATTASTAGLPAREVVIGDDAFHPELVVIEAGETVIWRNASVLVHSVTAHPEFATSRESFELPPGATPFHSGLLIPGDAYTHTFDVPGTYRYFCAPHEAARNDGWVEVRRRR